MQETRFIKIQGNEAGAHQNQTHLGPPYCIHGKLWIPDGYAVIPNDMETPNFPFGDITVEEINGIPTVTSWTPREIPEPEPDPVPEPSTREQIDELKEAMDMILTGVTE